MAIQRKDEILGKALAGDATVIPRYDVIASNGTKVAEDAQLVLKNPVLQQGMPFSAPLMNEVLAASGTTAGTASALTLAQTGFALTDGAVVRIKLHVNSGATPTLNINGTGAKAIKTAQNDEVFGYYNGKSGVWYELIYSAVQNAYLYNGMRLTDARKKTVIYDAANTASQFVVDVSSIDFSNVTTIGIEIAGVNVTMSSGQAYVTLRDANSNGLMTSAMTAVLGDGSPTQGTNCLLTFEFGSSVCASRSASNYYASLTFTNMVRCVPLFSKGSIKKADVYIQGSFRSGMNGRTVIWYA